MRKLVFGVLLLACMVGNSCEETVEFPGQFRPRLVLYCVLSTETDTQYVSLLSSVANQSENSSIPAANVDISDGTNLFSFHDTTISDLSGDSVHVFVNDNFRPVAGAIYFLRVTANGFPTITSKTAIPTHAVLDIDYPENAVIGNPWYGGGYPEPIVSFHPSGGASAYLTGLTLVYRDSLPGGTVEKRIPIPRQVEIIDCFFGKFKFRYTEIISLGSAGGDVAYRWENFAWRLNVDLARQSYNPAFERAVFTVTQFSNEWYKYYNSARIFQDRFSLRLDVPDYTNIEGGNGIFGSFVVDTVATSMPKTLSPPGLGNYNTCDWPFPHMPVVH